VKKKSGFGEKDSFLYSVIQINVFHFSSNLVQKGSTVYLLPLIGGFQPVSLVISKVPPQMKRDKVVF
jgi:hypothetical protein